MSTLDTVVPPVVVIGAILGVLGVAIGLTKSTSTIGLILNAIMVLGLKRLFLSGWMVFVSTAVALVTHRLLH